jgi:hypothetical protein
MDNLQANPEGVINNLLSEIASLHREKAILSTLVNQLQSEMQEQKERKTK